MTQAYSDPSRENDEHALPDIEVFYMDRFEAADQSLINASYGDSDLPANPDQPGWYWQSCFPGCLPDGDPIGPFATEQEALEDARDF